MQNQITDIRRDTKIPKTLRDSNLSADGKWKSFKQVPNLLQYVSTGTYFARIKVDGKLIRQALKNPQSEAVTVYSDAKLLLHDFLVKQREKKRPDGAPVTFGDALKLYETELEMDPAQAELSKRYRRFCIRKLNETWPELKTTKLARLTESATKVWAAKLAGQVDEQYYNNALGTFRQILRRAGIERQDDPSRAIKRLSVIVPKVELPTLEQFHQILREMETSGSGWQQHAADFARFLAYSGCRLSESRRVTWRDVDMEAGRMIVHSAKKRRAGGEQDLTRTVYFIPPMRELMDRLNRGEHQPQDPVCRVGECEKSLRRACARVGAPKLTHHRLRDLFATVCVESGIDVPTVAGWLGHRDGGSLLLKRYHKHRDEHSREMAGKVDFGSTKPANVVPMPAKEVA